jgi:hypothetical protein
LAVRLDQARQARKVHLAVGKAEAADECEVSAMKESELDKIFKDHAANMARVRGLYLTAFGRRKRSYLAYDNGNGTFHVLQCDEGGGYIVADEIQSQPTALLIVELLNFAAAVSGCQPGEAAKMCTPAYGRVS